MDTRFPVFADSLAASNISVTVTFVSSDDKPSTFAPSSSTALKYVNESSYGAGTGLAFSIFASGSPLRRTSNPSLFTVTTDPVAP